MIGEIVIVRIPLLDDGLLLIKLLGVEASGIWIESQSFTDRLMEKFRCTSSRTTPIVFVPYDKLDFIIASLDSLGLRAMKRRIR